MKPKKEIKVLVTSQGQRADIKEGKVSVEEMEEEEVKLTYLEMVVSVNELKIR